MSEVVGREAEREALRDAFRAASEGKPQVVLLEGPPGIGKTHLTEWLRGSLRAERPDALVGYSRCVSSGEPLRPLWDGVADLMAGAPGTTSTRASQIVDSKAYDALSEIVTAVPGISIAALPLKLGKLFFSGAKASEKDTAELERLRAVPGQFIGEVVRRGARSQPLVFAVDDLHWADTASLEVVFGLMRTAWEATEPSSLMVVASYRTSEAQQSGLKPRLEALTRRYGKSGGNVTRHLCLEAMSREEAAALAEGAAGGIPLGSPDVIEWLHVHCAGNPLAMGDLVTALWRSGLLVERDGLLEPNQPFKRARQGLTLPSRWTAWLNEGERDPALRSALSAADALPEDHARLLRTAALLGTRFRTVLLAKILERPERVIVEDLAVLCRQGLLREAPGNHFLGLVRTGAFEFSSDSHRTAFESQLGVRQRQVIHEAAAEVLTTLHDFLDEADLALIRSGAEDARLETRIARERVLIDQRRELVERELLVHLRGANRATEATAVLVALGQREIQHLKGEHAFDKAAGGRRLRARVREATELMDGLVRSGGATDLAAVLTAECDLLVLAATSHAMLGRYDLAFQDVERAHRCAVWAKDDVLVFNVLYQKMELSYESGNLKLARLTLREFLDREDLSDAIRETALLSMLETAEHARVALSQLTFVRGRLVGCTDQRTLARLRHLELRLRASEWLEGVQAGTRDADELHPIVAMAQTDEDLAMLSEHLVLALEADAAEVLESAEDLDLSDADFLELGYRAHRLGSVHMHHLTAARAIRDWAAAVRRRPEQLRAVVAEALVAHAMWSLGRRLVASEEWDADDDELPEFAHVEHMVAAADAAPLHYLSTMRAGAEAAAHLGNSESHIQMLGAIAVSGALSTGDENATLAHLDHVIRNHGDAKWLVYLSHTHAVAFAHRGDRKGARQHASECATHALQQWDAVTSEDATLLASWTNTAAHAAQNEPLAAEWAHRAAEIDGETGREGDRARKLAHAEALAIVAGDITLLRASREEQSEASVANAVARAEELRSAGQFAEALELLSQLEKSLADDPDGLGLLDDVLSEMAETHSDAAEEAESQEDTPVAREHALQSLALRRRAVDVCRRTGQWRRALEELNAALLCTPADAPNEWSELARELIATLTAMGDVAGLEELLGDLNGMAGWDEPPAPPADIRAMAEALIEESEELMAEVDLMDLHHSWAQRVGAAHAG